MKKTNTPYTGFCSLKFCLAFTIVALFAPHAHAGMSLALSAGSDIQINKPSQYQATNVMVTPGIEALDILHLELGFLGMLNAQRDGLAEKLGLEVRPMLRLTLPLIPIYGRLIVALVEPFSAAHRTVAYGPVLGVEVSLLGLGVFAEAGVLPRYVDHAWNWITEGRVGISMTAF